MKKTIVFVLSLLIFLLIPSIVYAAAEFSVSVDSSSRAGWGESASVPIEITCQNGFRTCECRDWYTGQSDWSYFDVNAGTSTNRYYRELIPTCGTGSTSVNYQVYCTEFLGSGVTKTASFTLYWPTTSQESTYNSASEKRSSASSKISSASAAISDAISAINNGNSYGSACVDVSQAKSYLQTAQSKKTSASTTLSSANSYWSACSYTNAKNFASNAESTADDSIDSANNAKDSAQNAIDSYNDKKNQAISDISSAESTIQSAQTSIDDANDLVEKAKSKSSCIKVANIEKRLSTARESLRSAESSKNSAKTMKSSCGFSKVSSYTTSAKNDANSARDIGLSAKQEIINLLNEYDIKKGNSDIELNNAKQLIENARAEIDKVEIKLKKSEATSCIEELGLASATALKSDAESFLGSANEEYTLAKSNYNSCDFDASVSNSKKAQGFANKAKPKATGASNKIDSIVEEVQSMKDLIEDDLNKVKNKIDTAENIDNTIGELLETHPEETLGKKAFSEAKAKREQGREKIRAAKTDYEKAGIDFSSGDCSKTGNTIKSASDYATEAEKIVTASHDWITLKIQESGDCANRINNANEEMNKLYFKSEFGRFFIVDSLDSLIKLTSKNIELLHISTLQKDIREEALQSLINLDKSKLRLDEGDFDECITLAESVRDSAVKIRRKSEEVVAEISTDMQNIIPILIETYVEENKNTKETITSKSKYAITGKENIGIANTKAKENDRIIEEIKSVSQNLKSLNGLDEVMEQSQSIATNVDKIEDNTNTILIESLPSVNKTFYKGLLIGFIVAVLIGFGIYSIPKIKAKRLSKTKGKKEDKKQKEKEPSKKKSKKEKKPSISKFKSFFSKKKKKKQAKAKKEA